MQNLMSLDICKHPWHYPQIKNRQYQSLGTVGGQWEGAHRKAGEENYIRILAN